MGILAGDDGQKILIAVDRPAGLSVTSLRQGWRFYFSPGKGGSALLDKGEVIELAKWLLDQAGRTGGDADVDQRAVPLSPAQEAEIIEAAVAEITNRWEDHGDGYYPIAGEWLVRLIAENILDRLRGQTEPGR